MKTASVINLARKDISGWNSPLSKINKDKSESFTLFSFPQAVSVEIPQDYFGWILKLNAKGFIFQGPWEKGELSTQMRIEEGGQYRIIDDPDFPPFAAAEEHRAFLLCTDLLEQGHEINQEGMSEDDRYEPWYWISRKLSRAESRVSDVQEMLVNTSASLIAPWYDFYRPCTTEEITESQGVAELIEAFDANEAFRYVVYFRGLDRFPGGNSESYTIKYSLEREGFLVEMHTCFDGSHFRNETPMMLEHSLEGLENIKTLLRDLVLEEGSRNVEMMYFSPYFENEDEDEEIWNSIEILLYSNHRPIASTLDGENLVFRAHLSTSNCPDRETKYLPKLRELTQSFERFFDLCGPGRMLYGEPCRGAQNLYKARKNVCWDELIWAKDLYIMPFYLGR